MTRALDTLIVLLGAAALLIAALGGVDYAIGPLTLRLHSAARVLLLLAVVLALRAWRSTITADGLATRGLLALLVAAGAMYATHHVRVCGGLDSYGYISTATLLASGRLHEPQTLAPLLPFDDASHAAAPLGYVAGADGRTQVPRFPLGLPAVMALFTIFGATGPFFVPLLAAFGVAALAFFLARGLGNASVPLALFAAAVVFVDPLLVDYGIQPMSDAPAACWLLAATWLYFRQPRSTFSDYAAGACAGMAFLTRPALFLAAVAIGVVALDRPVRSTIRYGATLLAFLALQMAINVTLYGSAAESGYGPAAHMFEISSARLAANVSNFAKWMTFSHSAAFWLLWPAALIVLRRRKYAWQLSGVAAAAAAPYLFYLVFDDWESSRFVLPAILLVLMLAAMALGTLLKAVPGNALLFLAIALGCAAASHRFLDREGVYRFGDLEAKYRLAGEWIQTHLPERAVVLAELHSGSIRLYGGRQTIRWSRIPSDKLAPTLRNLAAAGYEPYLALDASADEPSLFADQFRSDPAGQPEPIGRIRVVNIYRFAPAP